ncbi:MAG: murein biosynthesis integral membrane protein MurJ, partial [Eubacteriales bacterium]
MITGRSIAKGALVVMAATLLSRLFGFVREMKIAEYFGLKGATDAFLVAYSIPSGVGMAVAAAISAGFIPILNSYLVQNDRDNASKVANTLFNVVMVALVALTTVGMLFAPMLVELLAPGFRGESVRLTAELIRLMFPGLIFFSMMGLASGFLNSRQHFLLPALGPMVTSIVVIGSIVVFGRSHGIKGLAAGTLAGVVAQFLLQIPAMYKKGFRYRLQFAIFHPGVVKVFKLMGPVLVASMVPPLMLLVERGLASKLTTGSISALNYAFRLMQLPQGLFVMAVSVPLFPALSSLAAQKDFTRLKEVMVKGIGVLALIMIPASAGLIALDEPVVRLLFQRGAFEAKDTVPTAYALAFYALALFPLAMRDIFRRSFYAVQDTMTPVIITVAAFIFNIILDLFLIKLMGIGGLALGAALSVFAEAGVLYFILNEKLQSLPGKSFLTLLAKLIVASVIMGVTAYFFSSLIGARIDLGTARGRMIQVGVSVISGLIVYLGAIILFRVEEVREA